MGLLKIENGALIFVKRSGLVNQKDYVVQNIPLKAIRSISVQGTVKRSLVIMTDNSIHSGIPRHEFTVPAPDHWAAAIRNEVDKENQGAVQSQQPIVREVVREIVKYPCPYCNTLMEITLDRCPSCGAPQRR